MVLVMMLLIMPHQTKYRPQLQFHLHFIHPQVIHPQVILLLLLQPVLFLVMVLIMMLFIMPQQWHQVKINFPKAGVNQ